MADLDLRPLSLGEILDRTFWMYRRNFLLFLGITAIPEILDLGYHLLKVLAENNPVTGSVASGGDIAAGVLVALIGIVIYVVVYLAAQGGTVFAVSELYLGRSATIIGSLRRMRGHVLKLFGVSLLNGLACGVAALLLIIPGIYLACRTIVCIPTSILEDLGPSDSLSRSMALTKDSAGRSFVIYLLWWFLLIFLVVVFVAPAGAAEGFYRSDPGLRTLWAVLGLVGAAVGTTLVTPILTIATAIYYYDLRVRKEAFDLQLLMEKTGRPTAIPATGLPTA